MVSFGIIILCRIKKLIIGHLMFCDILFIKCDPILDKGQFWEVS